MTNRLLHVLTGNVLTPHVLCFSVASYCADTIPKVAEIVQRLIQEPFREHVNMDAEAEYVFSCCVDPRRCLGLG